MLDHVSYGAGRDVLFVHGNSLNKEVWTTVVHDAALEGYRCIAIDLPGHGGSPRNAALVPYTLEGMALELAQFAQGLNEPFLVGHSLGGHVLMRTLKHLPKASGLVLLGTPPLTAAADFSAGFLPSPALAKAFNAELTEEDARDLAIAYTWAGNDQHGTVAAMILEADPRVRQDMGREATSGAWSDEVAMLRAFKKPVGVMHGSEDPFVSLPYLQGIATGLFHGDQIHVLEGSGHSPHMQKPLAFAQALADWLGRSV